MTLRIFPVSSSVNPGAETTTYYAYDITGMAEFISDYSDDLPRADVFGEPQTVHICPIGSSYQFSTQDIRASRYSGKSLDVRRGEAARKFIDRLINRIAWCGDEKRGLRGILSANNQVPIWTPSAVELPGGDSDDGEKLHLDPEQFDCWTTEQIFKLAVDMGIELGDAPERGDIIAKIAAEEIETGEYSNLNPEDYDQDNPNGKPRRWH